MIPYFVLLGVPAMWALVSGVAAKKKQPKNLIIFFFVWFFAMLALRSVVCGIDLSNYHFFYSIAKLYPFKNSGELESGYYFLESVVACFGGDFQVFLTVVAAITAGALMVLYRKESDIPYLTVALFVTVAPFSMFFSGLRQATALALVVPAYYATKHKKLILFLLSVAVAYSLHNSAFILLAMYPMYHVRLKRINLLWMVPTLAFVFAFRQQIFRFFLQFLGEKYIDRYSYLESTGAYTVFILLLVFLLYAFFIPSEKTLDYDTVGLRNLLFLTAIIQSFASVHSLAMRMNYYYLLFVPIIIPRIAKRSSEGNKKIANLSVIVMCVFFTLYFFYKAYFGEDVLRIYPYVPFWST